MTSIIAKSNILTTLSAVRLKIIVITVINKLIRHRTKENIKYNDEIIDRLL